MANYKFTWLNGNAEVVDPTIKVDKEKIIWNHIAKTASCTVVLTDSSGSNFGVELKDMPINNTDLNLVDIDAMALEKLKEFEVK